jgi:hypothetical protein
MCRIVAVAKGEDLRATRPTLCIDKIPANWHLLMDAGA